MDGYAYRNPGYRWRWTLLRVFELARWLRFLAPPGVPARARCGRSLWQRDLPSSDAFAVDLERSSRGR